MAARSDLGAWHFNDRCRPLSSGWRGRCATGDGYENDRSGDRVLRTVDLLAPPIFRSQGEVSVSGSRTRCPDIVTIRERGQIRRRYGGFGSHLYLEMVSAFGSAAVHGPFQRALDCFKEIVKEFKGI